MSSDDGFLGAAAAIGRRITAGAVWCDGRCGWVGAVADEAQPWRAEYRALEPQLYDGTAGVGLFLARLAAVTGEPAARRTAVGALRHALARARAAPPEDGFHAGSLGIAWAAAVAGSLLEEEELREGARTLPAPPSGPGRCPDVVLGGAGAILAQLALADAFDDPSRVEHAHAAGEELLGQATVTRHGWCWAVPGRGRRHHLCGLSHGAAGIGWALAELLARTGDERFRPGAAGAFAYERSWLDTATGTWPDLRVGGQRRGGPRRASPACGTWCHGEGGIALTRLRAVDLIGAEACGDDAALALAATRRELARALPHEIADLTLCHGAAGAADVLLCAAPGTAALSCEAAREGVELATQLGRAALERYGAADAAWPCDAGGGTTPALFRGLSGIGWWFLRLHDPGIPSPLTLPFHG